MNQASHCGIFLVKAGSIVMEFANNGDLSIQITKHTQQGTKFP